MTIRTLSVLVLLMLVSGHGYSQPAPSPHLLNSPPVSSLPQNIPSAPPAVPVIPASNMPPPNIPPITPAIPVFPQPTIMPVKEKSLDQLLDELETLRAQKAEIEKKEQALTKTIQQKATKQADRMMQLGITPPAPAGAPIRVGQILIEGNIVTTDEAILKLVNLHPGQVFEYPMLEQARMRLTKAGYPTASVEVVPGDKDSIYKDVRVKVVERDR